MGSKKAIWDVDGSGLMLGYLIIGLKNMDSGERKWKLLFRV